MKTSMIPSKIEDNEIEDFDTVGAKSELFGKHDENDEITAQNGVNIAWKNLRVTADIKKHRIFRSTIHNYKKIIHDVDGYVESSSFVAILGASGSGKSTLMSALANRQSGDLKISGDIRINGRKLQLKQMKEISGFVYQDELFVPKLTVLEHLHFAAILKLDKNISTEHRRKLIDELIKDVGLTKCANNFIGSANYGDEKIMLSGGERKRLSVATELVTDPPLLFCDEPTTGLDSFTSLQLMIEMRNMINQRATTIICSVHQPSEQIFNLFHQIILLHEGRIAFSGTTKEALTFFQSIGYRCSEEQNPAEYLIKCLAVVPEQQSESFDGSLKICTEFEESRYAEIIRDRIEVERHKTIQDFGFIRKKERISWYYMLYLMIHRQILVDIMRNAVTIRLDMVRKTVVSIVIGICMTGTSTTTQNGILLMKGIFTFTLSENCTLPVYIIFDRIPSKMPIFFREYTNNINTPLLFYLSNLISMIPLAAMYTIVNVTLTYIIAGLRNSWTVFCWTLISLILATFTSTAFGIFLSLLTNSANMATTIFTPIHSIWLISLGVFINLKSIPWVISWIRYTSWMSYAMEIVFGLQLDGVDHIACPGNTATSCLSTGDEVLRSMDFDANNLTRNLSLICIICFILSISGYFVLKIKLYFKIR